MSESSDSNADAKLAPSKTGRYLYCLVDISADRSDAADALDTTGIEGDPVTVVTADEASVGAVVHPRDEAYDSTDLTKLRDWLLAHQRVVEAAGETFGTPLPVRFDTIIEGDDDAVITWMNRNADAIAEAFDSLGDAWEYRVTLSWDSTAFETKQRASDSELADIDRRLSQSGAGKRFLLQKQFDQRLRTLVQRRQQELKELLVDRLEETAIRTTERPVQSEAATSLGVELDSDAIAQVAVLARKADESALGAILDDVIDIGGVDIRFTGPWPPYTFAPTIEDN